MHRNLRLFYLLIFVTIIAVLVREYTPYETMEMKGVEASAFSISDTATVSKIFIADKDGGQALLERIPGQRYWSLNGRYLARRECRRSSAQDHEANPGAKSGAEWRIGDR